jgi:sulfhydrogenase subunit delta
MARPAERPLRVGVVKLTSCDGCQLTILNLEDQLLELATWLEFVDFPEATSHRVPDARFDVLFVEGSISTPQQAGHIVELRERADTLVSIGACATSGGIQALRNWADELDWRASVYPTPEVLQTLPTATPVSDHVTVDHELHGCPIAPSQLLELLTALRVGRRPQLPDEAVCAACKRLGRVCVLVAGGTPCLGPLTVTGCGALCPAFARGCYACFGPRERANVDSLLGHLRSSGVTDEPERLLVGISASAPPFRDAAGLAIAAEQGDPDARD